MAARDTISPPPDGTGPSGESLWRSILSDFDLEIHETALLREAVRTTDQLDILAAVVAKDGPMVSDNKIHPALVESRQLRLTLARLLAALRLPTGDEEDQAANKRPQRRGGPRTPYAIRGV